MSNVIIELKRRFMRMTIKLPKTYAALMLLILIPHNTFATL
jgi:hypothetical protein